MPAEQPSPPPQDEGGEYFYNESTQMLYVIPNSTDASPPGEPSCRPHCSHAVARHSVQPSRGRRVFELSVLNNNNRWTNPSLAFCCGQATT